MSQREGYFVRFSARQRLEHAALVALFLLLGLTGFPQKWPDLSWSQAISGFLGGVEHARLVHRISGVLLTVLAFGHLAIAGFEVLTGRARPSMFVSKQDFADAIQTLRYYLGLVDQPAKFDRFDYKQKFEYWGLVLGGLLMIATGFLLYFPVFFTGFLPGEFIPAAKAAHSNEGLMAFLVVITWHIYNAHLAPEIFPFDTSIFTGKVSMERMRHEHPLELASMPGGDPDPSDRQDA